MIELSGLYLCDTLVYKDCVLKGLCSGALEEIQAYVEFTLAPDHVKGSLNHTFIFHFTVSSPSTPHPTTLTPHSRGRRTLYLISHLCLTCTATQHGRSEILRAVQGNDVSLSDLLPERIELTFAKARHNARRHAR